MIVNINDYEYCSTKVGGELEVWEHKETQKIIFVPIEIVRDFDNVMDENYKTGDEFVDFNN
jgi:hypothetical protein